jgi:hypothetical protein
MRVELGLAWAGIRYRTVPWLLLTLGVAVAVALPVLSAGLRSESAVAAVVSTVDALPPAERTVLAVTSTNLRGPTLTEVDRTVRAGLAADQVAAPVQSLTFRPLSLAGTDVTLGAMDGLGSRVRLTTGVLPRSCTASRCEVLAVRAPGSAQTIDPAAAMRPARQLGLVVTGTADLVDDRLVGAGVASANLPLLLGDDPNALADLSSLQLFGRILAWYGTLDGPSVASQGPGRFGQALAQLVDQVNVAGGGPLSISWPVDAVTAAADRAARSASRFAVLGAGAGALQLGFCLVLAAGMRRRQQLVGLLLSRRGATTAQVLLAAVLQAAIAVVAGALLGTLGAAGLVAVRASSSLDAAKAAEDAVGSSLWVLAALTALAIVLVGATGAWPTAGGRSARWLAAFGLVSSAGVVVLALANRGPDSSGATGADLLPTLAVVAFVAAVGLLVALAWPLLAAAIGRARRTPVLTVPGSTAIIARRRPLVPMITAGFLAAACCLLVFTGGYRQSLRQSAADQAAAQVPLDATIAASALVSVPLDVLDPAALRAAAPTATVHPVVTSVVAAFAGTSLARAFPLTGVDPAALPKMHEFAATTGATIGAEELARRLTTGHPPDPGAPVIPSGSRRVSLTASGDDAAVTVSLWLSTAEGRQHQVSLTRRGGQLTARLEAGPAQTVQAVEIAETASTLMHRQHGVGEGTTDRALTSGTLRLGSASADGVPLSWSWTGWGSGQSTVSVPDPGDAVLTYQIAQERVVVTPGYVAPADRPVLPVAVDPTTAAAAGATGRFGISVNGQTVPVQVVAVLQRFPGIGKAFVLADRTAVVALLNRSAPGTAAVTQVWIDAPGDSLGDVRDILGSTPVSTAKVTYRSELERAIADDPVATRSILLLSWAGVIALTLAMVAAAATVRADLEESRTDQLALELDGLTPGRLRGRLLTRAALVAVVGTPLGIAGGVLATVVGVRLLVTGPGGAVVVPPLRPVLGALPLLAVVAAAVVGVALASTVTALSALREPFPQATQTDLR